MHFDVGTPDGGVICDAFDTEHSRADGSGQHRVQMPPYGHRWYRVGGPDTAMKREELF